MAPVSKQKQDAAALATFKYGMPVYGLAWPQDETFYLCGGGGMGIKNRVVGAQRLQGMLTDQVTDFDFGDNCPTRLAVTPNGKSIAVAMSKGGIKRLDIDAKGSKIKLTEVSGDLAQRLAADKSEIKCLAFTPRGDTLILGGVDGSLKIVAWPSLEVKLHLKGDAKLPDGVRDVSGAPGPRATRCAVVLEDGTAQIWDWDTKEACCKAALGKKGEPIASNTIMNMVGPSTSALQELPTGMLGARFASLRYAPLPSTTPALPAPGTPSTPTAGTSGSGASERVVLHALMNNRMGSWVVTWEQDYSGMLTMTRYKRVGEEPASCFDLSPCGKLLAVGTSDAAILVLNSADLSIVRVRHKAHTVFCTGVCFAPDSKHVLSVSGDASATLTPTIPLKSSIETIHRFIVGLVLLLAFMMAGLLVTVRIAKATGNRQLVERIGTLLRFLNIIDN